MIEKSTTCHTCVRRRAGLIGLVWGWMRFSRRKHHLSYVCVFKGGRERRGLVVEGRSCTIQGPVETAAADVLAKSPNNLQGFLEQAPEQNLHGCADGFVMGQKTDCLID